MRTTATTECGSRARRQLALKITSLWWCLLPGSRFSLVAS